jgi:hypothetical protein
LSVIWEKWYSCTYLQGNWSCRFTYATKFKQTWSSLDLYFFKNSMPSVSTVITVTDFLHHYNRPDHISCCVTCFGCIYHHSKMRHWSAKENKITYLLHEKFEYQAWLPRNFIISTLRLNCTSISLQFPEVTLSQFCHMFLVSSTCPVHYNFFHLINVAIHRKQSKWWN